MDHEHMSLKVCLPGWQRLKDVRSYSRAPPGVVAAAANLFNATKQVWWGSLTCGTRTAELREALRRISFEEARAARRRPPPPLSSTATAALPCGRAPTPGRRARRTRRPSCPTA